MFKLQKMVFSPESYINSETKSYKEYEKTMEEAFWNSRINTKTFSLYEK